jgi:hypothetical protein
VILVSGDLRKLLKAAEAQGFTVERTSKGHWLVRDAEGLAVATIAGTASDHRSWRNALAYLRKAGFIWPPAR